MVGPLDLDQVEALVEIVSDSNLSEVSVRGDGWRVRVKRAVLTAPASTASTPPSTGNDHQPLTATPLEPAETVAASPRLATAVTSTQVGTFRAHTPPRQVGDVVSEGDILGLIESMKVPSPVAAPASGILLAVPDDGVAVEYGQLLFSLAPEEAGGST
jgi:acetyl-CoA carboxylase biotin carboxyl carrier protein